MPLHNTQKLYHDLGRGADQDLPLAAPLRIDDVVLSQSGFVTITGVLKQEMDKQGSHSA